MFDRRLKIFLGSVFAIMLILMLRTLQIQIVKGPEFTKRAESLGRKPTFVETVRGQILDRKGRVLAEDVPCIDAMVDYRAIVPDPDEKWLHDLASSRLSARLGEEYTKAQKPKRDLMLADEIVAVKHDLDTMWTVLAQCPGMDADKIADARQEVVRRVENRARMMWYRAYEKAIDKHDKDNSKAWYAKLLTDDDKPPEVDDYKKTIGDELIAYPIVPALDQKTITVLGRNLGNFPGLSLQPSTHRYYPYKEIGCHWLGSVAAVTKEERLADPNFADERRRYDMSDLIGRGGIEALAEPLLRGTRGLIERDTTSNVIVSQQDAVPGKDVVSTIDIELQQDVQEIFADVTVPKEDPGYQEHRTYHGAAVVIDIPTGQVRAMASYPAYDPNELDKNYAKLALDNLNQPMLNRATMDVLEPGSTVKPMVGLWGMKTGALGIDERIECTGFMMYNGKPQKNGRCWVTRALLARPDLNLKPINHPIPVALEHDLSFADALERSCNPFHETVANRLGFERLSEGFSAFGLGQATGIGIPERIGRLPTSYSGPEDQRLFALWSSGIGQGPVAATPLQMCNAVATIARGGIWIKPRILNPAVDSTQLHYAIKNNRPDRVDLEIPPGAIAMAHRGMMNVVIGSAGTGPNLNFPSAVADACGKTGSAQAAMFTVPELDANGQIVPKLNENGQPILRKDGSFLPNRVPVQPYSPDNKVAELAWYQATGKRRDELTHGWYIGFAPRDNPQIAFCVLTEYGGTGGIAAAAVARKVLEACVAHDYLPKSTR